MVYTNEELKLLDDILFLNKKGKGRTKYLFTHKNIKHIDSFNCSFEDIPLHMNDTPSTRLLEGVNESVVNWRLKIGR